MELSGVGEPARLAAWANTTGFRLDGIVVAADADQIVELAGRRYVGDTVRAQLMAADLVVLTKTDLADRPALARRFVERSTAAPVFDGARLDPMALFGVGGAEPMLRPPGPDRHGPDRHRPDRHGPESVDVSGLRRAELAAIVDGLDDDVVRAKGVIRCVDVPALVEVQVVGRRRVLRERPDLSTGHDVLVVIRQPA
jgi:G3E family GTPase